MSTVTIPSVSQARAYATEWLASHLTDRFAAGIPVHDFDGGEWHVPDWLSYPGLEPFGPVGELLLDDATGEVRGHTPVDELKARAVEIYQLNQESIEALLL
ncbi:MAG TPA: hypothetical protein VI756_24210 [Blastocatellia bacterium]